MTDLLVNRCPNCGQSLPPAAMRCQFCGRDFVDDRPAPKARMINVHPDTKAAIWYTVSCIFWIVVGLYQVIQATTRSGEFGGVAETNPNAAAEALGKSFGSGLAAIVYCIGILVAGAMLARSNWARKTGLVFSWLGTVFGALTMLFLLYEVFVDSQSDKMMAMIVSVIAFAMTFVTRYAINNTEGR